jgi:hypothetical protein
MAYDFGGKITKLQEKSSAFSHFSLVQKKNSLFLPMPRREKSSWSEKAYSLIYSSTVNLHNSLREMRSFKRKIVFIVVFVYSVSSIYSGAIPM